MKKLIISLCVVLALASIIAVATASTDRSPSANAQSAQPTGLSTQRYTNDEMFLQTSAEARLAKEQRDKELREQKWAILTDPTHTVEQAGVSDEEDRKAFAEMRAAAEKQDAANDANDLKACEILAKYSGQKAVETLPHGGLADSKMTLAMAELAQSKKLAEAEAQIVTKYLERRYEWILISDNLYPVEDRIYEVALPAKDYQALRSALQKALGK